VHKKKSFDEEMIDADVALEKEKDKMKRLDENFEEKTQRLAQMARMQQSTLSLPGMEKGTKFVMVDKQSSRLTDKGGKINDKVQARKDKPNDLGNTYNPFSIFSNFDPAHFVNVAQSYG
jgi:benzoyl-CoA reductase/2-hydroxyglutaryl-CoA dehydratase subunit BcrC/BadD/HgdB